VGGRYPFQRVDLTVEGKCYLNGEILEVTIAIDDGKIVSVCKPTRAPSSEERVVVKGKKVILPGMVDMHVHMRDLGETDKEDWLTGTLSALYGGVTFVGDMPNNKPYMNEIRKLALKKKVAGSKALVDFGFYSGFPAKLEYVSELIEFGILGFKIYPHDYSKDLQALIKRSEKQNALIVFHAEDPGMVEGHYEGIKNVTVHHILRPEEAEVTAVRNLLGLIAYEGIRIHFTHISSPNAVKEIIGYRAKGFKITCDTCPHYVLLDSSFTSKFGGIAKVNPPLRSEESVKGMRGHLRGGLIDAISTDHAPHKLSEKLDSDYERIPAGFPGLEICLPLLMKLILDEGFPLEILSLYSANPAAILRVPKGRISPGFDGDLVIYDYSIRWRVRGEEFHSKAKYTPFEGMEVVGKPYMVIIRGVVALEDGDVKVEKGFGRYVSPYGSRVSRLEA